MRLINLSIILIYIAANFGCSQSIFWDEKKAEQSLNKLATLSKDVVETSGLVIYQDRIWTFNDSGDASYIYEISQSTGEVLNKVEVLDAKNKDWELISRDEQYLYIGDTGNNNGDRARLTIYKISLEALDKAKSKVKYTEKMHYSYPEPHPNYDCEAMISMDNQLWVFTKNRKHQNTQLFSLHKDLKNQVANYLGEFSTKGLVTAAARHENKLLLLGYADREDYQPFIWVFNKFKPDAPFSTKAKGYTLPMKLQFEALVHHKENRYLLSNEGRGKNKPMLWEMVLK